MGKALYRKYRSRTLDEIVGQEHVTTVLKNALKQGRIGHAYLFTGPRGIGKTSIARILAYEINKLPYSDDSEHLDIIEIDAASNNGVDDIRDLRERVKLAPTSAAKKVYIIDEVHMLSKPAFNALLKTLEEPPEHIVFIMATTDIDKLPDTIISRTQRYAFKHATPEDIVTNLKRIAKSEAITIDDGALQLIAEHSGGSYRDSVTLLDQLASIKDSSETITTADIETSLGLASQKRIRALLQATASHDFDATISTLRQLSSDGIQPSIIALQCIHQIQADLDTFSSLLPLIEQLITVRQSPLPSALLLSILGTAASTKKIRTQPQTATAPTLASKDLPALAKKATEKHPVDNLVETLTPKKKKVIKADSTITTPSTTNWSTIFTDISSLSIGLRTVLAKCQFDDDGSSVIIYARNEFHQKKLDTAKYRRELSDFIEEHSGRTWDLDIRASSAPSKNPTIATVAAMMGGGEEISLEE